MGGKLKREDHKIFRHKLFLTEIRFGFGRIKAGH